MQTLTGQHGGFEYNLYDSVCVDLKPMQVTQHECDVI